MALRDRLAQVMDRIYDRMRDPAAFRIRIEDGAVGSFEGLRGHKYGLLITFRRNGEPVPSPVWIALDGQGRLFFETSLDTGKVKRIRRDGRVLVAPSDPRGKPKGPVIVGAARILPHEEWAHAETTLAAAFGLGRKLYLSAFHAPEPAQAYVEVVPVTG